ncbi:polysaccharide deacetylase family protein [Bacteroidota bacterium]
MKTKKVRYCLLSNDVETTSIWYNTLRDETAVKVLEEGMPLLLDLYAKYNIKTTFFFTGYIARLLPRIVKMVLPYGHEVASHGMSHNKEDGFDILSLKNQKKHLRDSKMILEDLSGQEVISFRAPALRVNSYTVHALEECGFKIDSSIASQRFDMFLSYGGLQKTKWLTAPRLPYRASKGSLFKKGESNIIEVPLSALLMPYISTTMRIFPLLTRIQKRILNTETGITGKPHVFLIHPNELIDESSEQEIINRRANYYLNYLLADLLRRKLKLKNLGPDSIQLYETIIQFYIRNKYSFATLKDYCSKLDL